MRDYIPIKLSKLRNPSQLNAVCTTRKKSNEYFISRRNRNTRILNILKVYFPNSYGIGDKIKDWNKKANKRVIGRIAVIHERAIKHRIVALADIYTQSVLSPLERLIMGELRRIDQDCTHNQSKYINFISSIEKKYGKNCHFVCIDLSAATDRFPIAYQAKVLDFLKDGLGSAWIKLLKREFVFNGKRVMYSKGTPIGTLTSWAVFAMCHHIVLQSAIYKSGRKHSDYLVLRDDVVYIDPNYIPSLSPSEQLPNTATHHYLDTMTKLRVSISLQKSVYPTDGCPSCIEFAKKQFIRRVDKSPIPINYLKSTKDFIRACSIMEFYINKFLVNENISLSEHKHSMQQLYINTVGTRLLLYAYIHLYLCHVFPDHHKERALMLVRWVSNEYKKVKRVRLASISTLLPNYVDAYLVNRDKTASTKTVFQEESIKNHFDTFAISQGYWPSRRHTGNNEKGSLIEN